MYRITYEQGNGYHCNCCRRTYEETIDYDTKEEVQEWVNNLYKSYKSPAYEDEGDRELISIEKEIGVDIQDEFKPQQEVVDKLVSQTKAEKAEKAAKYEQPNENFRQINESTVGKITTTTSVAHVRGKGCLVREVSSTGSVALVWVPGVKVKKKKEWESWILLQRLQ